MRVRTACTKNHLRFSRGSCIVPKRTIDHQKNKSMSRKEKSIENIASTIPEIENPDVECFVVGGGCSLKGFDFKRLASRHTVAVNSSVFDVPNPNYFITKDYLFLRRVPQIIELPVIDHVKKDIWNSVKKVFVAAFSDGTLQIIKGQIVDTRCKLKYMLGAIDILVKSYKQSGMGITTDDFRSGNDSGYSALQFAVISGHKKIYLLGYDLAVQNDNTHYHKRYGLRNSQYFQKKLNRYFRHYQIGLKELKEKTDVEVFSCSEISRLNNIIPYVSIDEVLG